MTKRILFVDDDPGVLSGLRRMLRAQRHDWDMTFAQGGEAALGELAVGRFDVVVTDMRMPGVDGAALLAELRRHHPDTVRIVLSGHSDLSATLRSVPLAHQFLNKPCEPRVLVAAVQRACALEERLQAPALRRLLGEMTALPSPPEVVTALNAVLASPDPSIDEVTRIVSRDPAIAAKLLQLVNSAFFGLAHRASDVREAVAYLGLNAIRNLAVAVEAFQALAGASTSPFCSVEDLQNHSLAVAQLARDIAPPAHAQDAFTAGLLHDVGVLALASSVPHLLAQVTEEVRRSGRRLDVVELEVLGATHADTGAYLLSLWGLPYPVVEAVAHHHVAPSVPDLALDALQSVYIAEALVDEGAPGTAAWEGDAAPLDEDYLRHLGATELVERLRAGRRGD